MAQQADSEISDLYLTMACHVWALSGNPDTAPKVDNAYNALCDELAGPHIKNRRTFAIMKIGPRQEIREEIFQGIVALREQRTELQAHRVFLCGGYREGSITPEHMWLEDHSDNITYDTMPNRVLVKKKGVGTEGQSFQPGWEDYPFEGDCIQRFELKGYTRSQSDGLAIAVYRT